MSGRSIRAVGDPEPSGDPSGQELARLLRRCARGDEVAFGEFYDATSSRAWGMALRVVRDRAQAEEVLQEAYLQAWRQASRFDPSRGSAGAWLLTIVHRSAVDRVRSAEASSRREQTYVDRGHVASESDTTSSTVEASVEAHRVRTALSGLTELQRQAVELAYWGGYTHTEVAGILDVPVGTAKTRIRDGLIRLRDTLGVEA